jgi:aryl-alcohol dehydrogenase-like predicted oxidoreductase
VEWGGNFIDTANAYGKGKSEAIIGTWLARWVSHPGHR